MSPIESKRPAIDRSPVSSIGDDDRAMSGPRPRWRLTASTIGDAVVRPSTAAPVGTTTPGRVGSPAAESRARACGLAPHEVHVGGEGIAEVDQARMHRRCLPDRRRGGRRRGPPLDGPEHRRCIYPRRHRPRTPFPGPTPSSAATALPSGGSPHDPWEEIVRGQAQPSAVHRRRARDRRSGDRGRHAGRQGVAAAGTRGPGARATPAPDAHAWGLGDHARAPLVRRHRRQRERRAAGDGGGGPHGDGVRARRPTAW